jgi:hypothetical protein
MIQLDPFKVMLVMSHTENTFDKKKLRDQGKSPFVKKTSMKIKDFIKDSTFVVLLQMPKVLRSLTHRTHVSLQMIHNGTQYTRIFNTPHFNSCNESLHLYPNLIQIRVMLQFIDQLAVIQKPSLRTTTSPRT